jgi:hypothetical protein
MEQINYQLISKLRSILLLIRLLLGLFRLLVTRENASLREVDSIAFFESPLYGLAWVVFNLYYTSMVSTEQQVARTSLVKIYMSYLVSVT